MPLPPTTADSPQMGDSCPPTCSPSSLTPETDVFLQSVNSLRPDGTHRIDAMAGLARKMERQWNGAKEMEQKYASELQTLCDLIIGGANVTAPFEEVKQRLLHIVHNEEEDLFQIGERFAIEYSHDVHTVTVKARHGNRLLCQIEGGVEKIFLIDDMWRQKAIPLQKKRHWWMMLFPENV